MVDSPRVLSIQSHVVSGYVGNKSATFPLQVLGFEVDAINSVHFSNHSGYKTFPGQILNDTDLDALVQGLQDNDLDRYTHLLTGYVRDDKLLKRIATLVKHLRTVNPSLVYVCDPVMGDNGRMYVPENLLPVYQNVILPLADVITPNQFEVEILTNRKINNVADAWKCIELLHEKGCKIIVVSSSELGEDNMMLLALASARSDNNTERLKIAIPKLPASFTGTGDLFAAIFLASMHKNGNKLKESLERTVATVQAVLRRTLHNAKDDRSAKAIELKLVQSKSDIEQPVVDVFATIGK